MSNLDEAIKEAYVLAPTDDLELHTLEVSHPKLPDGTLYLVRDTANHSLRLETGVYKTFQSCGFRITLPSKTEDGIQDMDMAIDNFEDRVSDFLEGVAGSRVPVKITYRPYLLSDPTTPRLNPPLDLAFTVANIGKVEVTGKASFIDIRNKKFLTENYNRERFPSLANG